MIFPDGRQRWHEDHRQGWNWWSEVKLQILGARDPNGFTRAVRGAPLRRSASTCRRVGSTTSDVTGLGTFPGSSRIALKADPPFTRLAFFELAEPAASLESSISSACPTEPRRRVFPGDCNDLLPEVLSVARSLALGADVCLPGSPRTPSRMDDGRGCGEMAA